MPMVPDAGDPNGRPTSLLRRQIRIDPVPLGGRATPRGATGARLMPVLSQQILPCIPLEGISGRHEYW